MTDRVQQLLTAVAELTPDERVELFHRLDEEYLPEADSDLMEELERRADAVEKGTAVGRPADDVVRDLRARFG